MRIAPLTGPERHLHHLVYRSVVLLPFGRWDEQE
jgi:hypothetical protein